MQQLPPKSHDIPKLQIVSSLNETQHEQTCHKETRHDKTKHDKKTGYDTTLIDLAAKPSQQAVHPMMIACFLLEGLAYAFFPIRRGQHVHRTRLVVESSIVLLSPSLASHTKKKKDRQNERRHDAMRYDERRHAMTKGDKTRPKAIGHNQEDTTR